MRTAILVFAILGNAVIFLQLCSSAEGIATKKKVVNSTQRPADWATSAGGGSRGLGYKKPGGRSSGPKMPATARPFWRPKEEGRIALAKQKGIDPTKIPEDDEEFKNVWPDSYYDDYDFEHKRNMIQHGTFESRIQNYHAEELAEAMAMLANFTAEVETTTGVPVPVDDGMK